MNVTNLSIYPHKPCHLLQWPHARVLLDTPVDFNTFFQYLPHVYQSQRLRNAKTHPKFTLDYLKEVNGKVYVQGKPEVLHVSPSLLEMHTIDAIIISNYDSLMGLPFYTENTGFRGFVYITEIALQFGRLLMEEMLEWLERVDFTPIDDKWKRQEVFGKFPNQPITNPGESVRFYTKEEMDSALAKITTLSYNQPITLLNITFTPCPSGHSFGSSNWLIKTENESFGYMAASSDVQSHVKPADYSLLRGCDNLLVTSMCRVHDVSPQSMGATLVTSVTETLKRNGNVILPIGSVGPIFEIIEAISDIIENNNSLSLDTPIYFISPIAKNVLAMASISAEWMSTVRLNSVYRPDEPFTHSAMVKMGRLKIYDSLYGAFSKEHKTPSIVITGHSSLRVGDAAHMIEVFANDNRNAVIMTDPDLAAENVREAFRNHQIRFINCPMDFRMDYNAMNRALNLIQPKFVLTCPNYSMSIQGRPDLMLFYERIFPIEYDEPCLLGQVNRAKRVVNVKVDQELMKSLKWRQHPTVKNYVIAPLNCHLDCYNDDFKLKIATGRVPRRRMGRIRIEQLLETLKKKKMEGVYSVGRKDGEEIVTIKALGNATITVMEDGKKTKITAKTAADREKLMNVLKLISKEDDGIYGRNPDILPIFGTQ